MEYFHLRSKSNWVWLASVLLNVHQRFSTTMVCLFRLPIAGTSLRAKEISRIPSLAEGSWISRMVKIGGA